MKHCLALHAGLLLGTSLLAPVTLAEVALFAADGYRQTQYRSPTPAALDARAPSITDCP